MKADREERLIAMAAQLLSISMQVAQEFSSANEVQNAADLHDRKKLYPKLTVTAPHGGAGIHLQVELCDPVTDQPAVRMFEVTALATVPVCH